jgi:nuclease S1
MIVTDSARKRIKELLPQGTTLADASTWPDKTRRQIPDMDPYHFINFPKDANTYNQQRDCKLRNCIIEAIACMCRCFNHPMRRATKSALHCASSLTSSATSTSRCMLGSLKIVAAIVLTCAFMAGSQLFTRVWDTALVELEQGTPAETAKGIQAAVTGDDLQQWQQGTPADWALESLAIVRAQVYRLPASSAIGATYVEPARAVVRTRLAQAGARLAWMLNESFRR